MAPARRWSPVTNYQLGSLAFTGGTSLWATSDHLHGRSVDPAMVAYAVGCLFFLEDAFLSLLTLSTRPSARFFVRLNSYRIGSLAYASGTAVWGIESWWASHSLDPVALIYGVGCAWFVRDAFVAPPARPRRRWWTDAQLGSATFLTGTIVWGFTAGWSWTVATYGLGCLFFLRQGFAEPTPSAGNA